ncbi:tyrosine-type recombinase/integrase [Actinomadura nitritigenes]|uniref:tyrosine-type recombinase/integrase n=1 Tax=Actinomadura nitritigenes TaxID=134602 RepID=UPI0036999049
MRLGDGASRSWAVSSIAGPQSAGRCSGSGSDLHFHDLRHVGNTLAATTGASLKELMSRMGHASSRAALIYQHASQDRDKAIAAALGEAFKVARASDKGDKGTAKRSGTQRARKPKRA